jgi:DNA-directed RNA polymerase specialized sigma24 family protein
MNNACQVMEPEVGTFQMLTDRELVAEFCVSRSEKAFAEIVERHGPMVFRTCVRALGGLAGAEDAAQAVFLILAQQSSDIRGSVASWLHGMALCVTWRILQERTCKLPLKNEAAKMQENAVLAGNLET